MVSRTAATVISTHVMAMVMAMVLWQDHSVLLTYATSVRRSLLGASGRAGWRGGPMNWGRWRASGS